MAINSKKDNKVVPVVVQSDNTRVETPHFKIMPPLTGKDIIMSHKRRFNVDKPYWYLDKKSNTLSLMKGDKTLKSVEVSLGRNKGDYYTSYDTWNSFDRNNMWRPLSATTGAGTYVVNSISSNMKSYTEPQIVRLTRADNKELVPIAIHAQTASRVPQWKAGNRRFSYGCISPAPQTMGALSKLFNIGDTVYIDTEEPGNKLWEVNGDIKAIFDKKNVSPTKKHTWGETYNTKVDYNGITR